MPDANIPLMDTHLAMTRAIGEVQKALVIADIDTGCGDAVDVAHVTPRHAETGADAVLIHGEQGTPDEILPFCHAWPGRVPLVLVPTSPPQPSLAEAGALGEVGLIIRGDHAIRAAVAAMRGAFRRILTEGGVAGVEADIASVEEVFASQGDEHKRQPGKACPR